MDAALAKSRPFLAGAAKKWNSKLVQVFPNKTPDPPENGPFSQGIFQWKWPEVGLFQVIFLENALALAQALWKCPGSVSLA